MAGGCRGGGALSGFAGCCPNFGHIVPVQLSLKTGVAAANPLLNSALCCPMVRAASRFLRERSVDISDPPMRDNLNWADCCDALNAEYWLRRLNEVKRRRQTQPLEDHDLPAAREASTPPPVQGEG